MKRSIFAKIFSGYLILILFLNILILVSAFSIIRTHLIHTLTIRLEHIGKALSGQILPHLGASGNQTEIQNTVQKKGREITTRITVILPGGTVVADSQEDPSDMENHRDRPEITEALKGITASSLRYSTTLGEEMLYVGIPLEKDGKIIAILRTSLYLKDINILHSTIRKSILIVGVIGIILSLAGAYILSRSFAKPIKTLAAAASSIGEGNFIVNVDIPNQDELKLLADAFEEMTKQIRILFSDLTLQKEELTSIISSIREGLLVLDPDGIAVLGNESFSAIISRDDFKGDHYSEILSSSDFSSFIKRVFNTEEHTSTELEISEAVYICSATYIKPKKEAVILFHNITKQKQLDRIKKDFVVNVSHELRTPLTAIKGYVETLKDESIESQKEYIEIIQRNTDRLVNIVEDLLTLSELEETGFQLNLEITDISPVIVNVLQIFQEKAQAKGLTLSSSLSDDIPAIPLDIFKIEQMLINLIENAIRYTEEGEVKISVKAGESGTGIIISVSDTGYGIPAEYSNQIFERFFVIDKSRSRKLGGTGLGLSIVKHIVMLHGGAIALESSPGKGTVFFITLPGSDDTA